MIQECKNFIKIEVVTNLNIKLDFKVVATSYKQTHLLILLSFDLVLLILEVPLLI